MKSKHCSTCGAKIAKGKHALVYDPKQAKAVTVCDKAACKRPYIKKGA